jgi:hypothetical protein
LLPIVIPAKSSINLSKQLFYEYLVKLLIAGIVKNLPNFRSLTRFIRVMRLRTNQVLKIFALLLFSLEFLAPAFLVDITVPTVSQDKVQITDGGYHQNILYSILTEEVTENEEGREDHREVILFTDIDFVCASLQLLGTKPASNKYSSIISEQFDTQPAIFKLNCNFLI